MSPPAERGAHEAAIGLVQLPETVKARKLHVALTDALFDLRNDQGIDAPEDSKYERPRKLLLAATTKKVFDLLVEKEPGDYGDLINEFAHESSATKEFQSAISDFTKRWKAVERTAKALVEHLDDTPFLREFNTVRNSDDRQSRPGYTPEMQIRFANELSAGLEHVPGGIVFLIDSVAAPRESSAQHPYLPMLHPLRLEGWKERLPNVGDLPPLRLKPGTDEVDTAYMAKARVAADHLLNAYLHYGSKIVPLVAAAARKGKLDPDTALGQVAFVVFDTLYKDFDPKANGDVSKILEEVRHRHDDSKSIWLGHRPNIASSILLVFSVLSVHEALVKFDEDRDAGNLFTLIKEVSGVSGAAIEIFGGLATNPAVARSLGTATTTLGFIGVFAAQVAATFDVAEALESPDLVEAIGPAFGLLGAMLAGAAFKLGVLSASAVAPPVLLLSLVAIAIGLIATVLTAAFGPSEAELLFRRSHFGEQRLASGASELREPAKIEFRFNDIDESGIDRQISALLGRLQQFRGDFHFFGSSTLSRGYLIVDLEFEIPITRDSRPKIELHTFDGEGADMAQIHEEVTLEGPAAWRDDARQRAPFDLSQGAPREQQREIWRPVHERPDSAPADAPEAHKAHRAKMIECVRKAELPQTERRLTRLIVLRALDGDDVGARLGGHHEVRLTLHNAALSTLQRYLVSSATEVPFDATEMNLPTTLYVRGKSTLLPDGFPATRSRAAGAERTTDATLPEILHA